MLAPARLLAGGANPPAGVSTGADPAALATAFVADPALHRFGERATRDATAA